MPKPIRPALAIAMVAMLAAPALAAPKLPAGADPTVRPQDDLFRAVNGRWLNSTKIPGDKKGYGTFMILREKSNTDVRSLLDAAKGSNSLEGNAYQAFADTAAIERQGLKPLAGTLAAIEACSSLDDVAVEIGQLGLAGVSVPVSMGVGPDAKDPMTNAVYWGQSGLGLPNRDYYLPAGADSQKLRDQYVRYLETLNRLAHAADPKRAAKETMAFETAVAKIQWAAADRRDAVKTYNPSTRAEWAKRYPGFPWETMAAGGAMPPTRGSIVAEPRYFKDFAALAATTPLDTWKRYLRSRTLDEFSPHLPAAFRQANYEFKGAKLQGLTAQPPRWRVAVETTDELVGEAVGSSYVKKNFPPTAKAQMEVLVGNLLASYRDAIGKLPWMEPATRKEALLKLSKLRVKIGYPDAWRGYKGLTLDAHDATGDKLKATQFLNLRDMAEAGQRVDRSRWDLTPQTVNAYDNPVGNESVFPAAILQPPFFDPKADDAYNYGAIGAVIGHETSHGFDDQGRRFDADGKLRDWWTPADEKNFSARTDKLVAQYNSYTPLPNEHVNGKLTLGENIADLAGLTLALDAYHRSLKGKPAPLIDGATGDQRFFIGFARVWRSKSRPEWLHTRLVADPHSPEQFRTNGSVTNIDAFYDAFGLKPGDKLYKAPADRIHIW